MKKRYILGVVFVLLSFGVFAQQVNEADLNKLLEQINTRYDEQNPILSPDGKKLYFTRANDSLNIGGPKDKGDIWVSELGANGIWQKPVNLGRPVNDELKNYMLGFSADGRIMFLNNEKKLPGGMVINDGLVFSVFKNGRWSKPTHLNVDYLINRSSHQSGSVSADGATMVLSLQAYASRGGEDIYVCFYKNGRWTQPQNLGSTINTKQQEMTPYLSPDKKYLYFSSNGHGGKGGRDLFVSERLSEGWTEWSKPKNLGDEVNSNGVELNYFIDNRNKIAYFSSTQNSDGYGDIRAHRIEVEIKEEPVEKEGFEELVVIEEEENKTCRFQGIVTNGKTGAPVAAAINITGDGMTENVITDEATGKFEIEIPLSLDSVEVSIKAPGYMGVREAVVPQSGGVSRNFELAPLEVGETIRLNKVYFKRGTADLLEGSFAELDRVVEMLRENPNIKIELSGHTDNQGNSKLNLKLSQDRVDKVKQYLVEHGIDARRIKGKGYGGTRPVASNASEETRKLNRRVEIKILKN